MIKKTPEITYLLTYDKFLERLQIVLDKQDTISDIENKTSYVKAIHNCMFVYVYFLNLKYNENNKKLLPLKLAQIYLGEDNPINNFIFQLNLLYQATDTSEKENIIDTIIKDYPIELLENFKREIEQEISIDEYACFKESYQKNKISIESFCKNRIVEIDNHYGLDKTIIYMILAYFKSQDSIQNVWIIGSRAYGTYKTSSDIDLIIECDNKDKKNIIATLNKLPIINFFDIKFIDDKTSSRFLKKALLFGSHHFYNKNSLNTPKLILNKKEVFEIYKQFCIENFKVRFNNLISEIEIDNQDNTNKEKQARIINQIKRVLIRYNKFLKIELNKKNIFELLPLKIYKKAKQLNLGYNIDYCMEFLQELNAYYDNINSPEIQFKIGNEIVSKIPELYKISDYLESIKTPESYRRLSKIFRSSKYIGFHLDNSHVTYNASIYNIDDYSYNIILNYAKNCPEISKIWLTGSRVHEHSHKGSDINLLIDCELKNARNINRELKNLKIPYIIDSQCINEPARLNFVKRNSIYACRIFYNKKDFQIFWNTGDKKGINLKTSIPRHIQHYEHLEGSFS